uniref:Uncharacterized protein n=1 Tax=Arundo donax TaxID=35708 RepID=A0A0A9F3S9_ARUDO
MVWCHVPRIHIRYITPIQPLWREPVWTHQAIAISRHNL